MTDVAVPDLRWDTSTYFPGLDSREFTAASESLGATLDRLGTLYDRHDVRAGDGVPEVEGSVVDEVLTATNEAHDEMELLGAYVYAHVTTDATDATAQAALSRIERQDSRLTTLTTRLSAWLARFDVDHVTQQSEQAAAHDFTLRRSAVDAQHQMSEAEEALAAELSLTGSSAWSRLYGDLTSSIIGVVDHPAKGPTELPIFAIRGLATDAQRDVRRAAFDAELTAWEAHRVPLSAAMNAVKGETLTLSARRGWDHPLDAALHRNNVDHGVLEALQVAVEESFVDFRRYLHAKARLLGLDRLSFFDLFAPVGGTGPLGWEEATERVRSLFAGFSPSLGALAERAFSESWIDVAPRTGKVGGAFCMSMRDDESRILLNFDGSADGTQTLAHELGHAFHNTALAGRTALQRSTPMALAETASIFCETLAVDGALAEAADDDERLGLIELDLQGATQVVVDIHSRFVFESEVFARRAGSVVSADELCALMRQAQADTYGDGLDADTLHPYMWAAKPHYYGATFYNWPYTYGLLFGLGLFARFREDPDGFRSGYDDLLSSTGMADARALGARFGLDVGDVGFWRSSLDVLRGRIAEFEALVEARTAEGSS